MKNKLFKNKKRLFSMALAVLMIFSMMPFNNLSNGSVVKAADGMFDPDDLNWEFPYRCQDNAVEFEALKTPITVEAEKRTLTPIINKDFVFPSTEEENISDNALVCILFKVKIYNEQAGNRTIYIPYYKFKAISNHAPKINEIHDYNQSITTTFFYGDKIDVSYKVFNDAENGKYATNIETKSKFTLKSRNIGSEDIIDSSLYDTDLNLASEELKHYQFYPTCLNSMETVDFTERFIHNGSTTFITKPIEVVGSGFKFIDTFVEMNGYRQFYREQNIDAYSSEDKLKEYLGEFKEYDSANKLITYTHRAYLSNFAGESTLETCNATIYINRLLSSDFNAYGKFAFYYFTPIITPAFNGGNISSRFNLLSTTSRNLTVDAYDKDDNKVFSTSLTPGNKYEIKENISKINKLVTNGKLPGFTGDVHEATPDFPGEEPSADEKAKEEELAKAKEDAKKEIDKLENLTDEQADKAKTDIDNAPDTTTVDQIVEDAKKKDADNKTAADEKTKEEELAKAKEDAKKEINSNPDLTNADKDKYAKDIDNAKTVKEVRDILDEAKKKAEAKINENDPEYLKNKLKGLIEEAKRVRYPSEELEEAIDEAYDILLDRYSRVEDYKYAIENLERILQNMRDTRRNRFKLDVDDLNEKDEELTGKTETKWYIDVYNGKKRILSGQANYKGDFAIEIKKGKIKAKDTLKVVATDPQNDKKYKEVEIEVGGDSKETKDNKPTFNINDLLQADGSKPLTDLAVFPVGKNFYNVVQNGQKTTVYMDVKTFISGNRTMLPIRYIAYTLGFNVEYDNFTREAIFSNTENSALAKKTIRVNIDTGLMKDSYGNVFAFDVRPVLINNRIHASIANIARMFEASQGTIEDGINQTIEWDSARKAVYVFKNIK